MQVTLCWEVWGNLIFFATLMKFSKEEIKQFTQIVCVNCKSKDICESMGLKKEACGKIFNWKLYHTEDGSCPLTKEYINNLK